jgi:leader peptidase (prepilin peptidase) / N-methyltransferase
MSLAEQIIIVSWACLVGGAIGSFLNVVVYRSPRGLSLVAPPSHCPNCKHLIRWYDNIPVFGWLRLGGKCRDCRQPIAWRYPLVELITALMFGALTLLEFVLQDNLPPRTVQIADGLAMIITSDATSYLTLLYHLLLLCVLLCGGLIEFDGQRPPSKMYYWTLAIGLILPLQWVDLRPMKAWADEPTLLASVIDGLAGVAAAGVVAFVAWRLQRKGQFRGFSLGLLCVGAFLGWQAVLPIAIASGIVGMLFFAISLRTGRSRPSPLAMALWASAFFWIVFWAPLVAALKFP